MLFSILQRGNADGFSECFYKMRIRRKACFFCNRRNVKRGCCQIVFRHIEPIPDKVVVQRFIGIFFHKTIQVIRVIIEFFRDATVIKFRVLVTVSYIGFNGLNERVASVPIIVFLYQFYKSEFKICRRVLSDGISATIKKLHQVKYPGAYCKEFMCFGMFFGMLLFIALIVQNKNNIRESGKERKKAFYLEKVRRDSAVFLSHAL